MLCDCIVTMLKNTFDSLVCEFTAKAGEGGIFSRCRCNIFTIGNRFAGSPFSLSASSRVVKSFLFPFPSEYSGALSLYKLIEYRIP